MQSQDQNWSAWKAVFRSASTIATQSENVLVLKCASDETKVINATLIHNFK